MIWEPPGATPHRKLYEIMRTPYTQNGSSEATLKPIYIIPCHSISAHKKGSEQKTPLEIPNCNQEYLSFCLVVQIYFYRSVKIIHATIVQMHVTFAANWRHD